MSKHLEKPEDGLDLGGDATNYVRYFQVLDELNREENDVHALAIDDLPIGFLLAAYQTARLSRGQSSSLRPRPETGVRPEAAFGAHRKSELLNAFTDEQRRIINEAYLQNGQSQNE